ncbi:MAG TPA: OsmC family protein [Candidatus Acidoferrales bacterium]|nr:OsmC family protein [Candidatus Acidoferrales bacterium]
MQTATVRWAGGEKFVATMPSGRSIQFDTSSTHADGPSPMEALLGALGACTSVDVAVILAKKRQKLESLEVVISGERAPSPPQIWTKIEMVYRLSGDLDEKAVSDAIKLSQEKYCSVAAMLGKAAQITYRYEILPQTAAKPGTATLICLLTLLWALCPSKAVAGSANFAGNWVLRLGTRPLMVLTLQPGSTKEAPYTGSLSRPQHFSVSETAQFSKIREPVVTYPIIQSSTTDNCVVFTTQNPSDKKDQDRYRLCSANRQSGMLGLDVPGVAAWPVSHERHAPAVATDWESRAYSVHEWDVSNPRMKQIFEQDQHARELPFEKIDWAVVGKEDAARRAAARTLLAEGKLHTGADFDRAAVVFQHGDKPDDYLMAHTLAIIAVAKGESDATWIAAATLDRYLQSIHQPQIYGTQFNTGKRPVTQEPYNRALVSDSVRALLGVPPLSAQERQREKYNAEVTK